MPSLRAHYHTSSASIISPIPRAGDRGHTLGICIVDLFLNYAPPLGKKLKEIKHSVSSFIDNCADSNIDECDLETFPYIAKFCIFRQIRFIVIVRSLTIDNIN